MNEYKIFYLIFITLIFFPLVTAEEKSYGLLSKSIAIAKDSDIVPCFFSNIYFEFVLRKTDFNENIIVCRKSKYSRSRID